MKRAFEKFAGRCEAAFAKLLAWSLMTGFDTIPNALVELPLWKALPAGVLLMAFWAVTTPIVVAMSAILLLFAMIGEVMNEGDEMASGWAALKVVPECLLTMMAALVFLIMERLMGCMAFLTAVFLNRETARV